MRLVFLDPMIECMRKVDAVQLFAASARPSNFKMHGCGDPSPLRELIDDMDRRTAYEESNGGLQSSR